MRLRQAGRAGGEQDGDKSVGGNARDVGDFLRVGRGEVGKIETRQVEGVEVAVAQTDDIREIGADARERFGRLRGGLQADLAADQPGGETDCEMVAVVADVEQRGAGRQPGGQSLGVGEEIAHPARPGRQPGEHVVEAETGDQRQRVHEPLADARWRQARATSAMLGRSSGGSARMRHRCSAANIRPTSGAVSRLA